MRIYASRNLTWKGDLLFLMGKGAPAAEVVRDVRYPEMWRFRLLPDGVFSDMVNLTRAKDGARGRVLAGLNRQETPRGAVRIGQMPEEVVWVPPELFLIVVPADFVGPEAA